MFALPSDYVAAQDAGKAFVADYYGRLNTSAESVVAMFTQSSRYYSMDSLNGRPAVGLADIFREVRRFLGTYSGGRRFASVVSVDAQIDGTDGGQATRNFGRYDSDDTDNDDLNDHGAPYLAVFVRAEWTDTARRSLVPLPFVQTFRVRWLTATVPGHRFKIDITVVKTMVATVQPLLHEHQLQRRHRRLDATQRGFSNYEREENRYNTSITRQFKQETYAGYTKHLNAEAREFELLSDTMLPPHLAAQSTDDELEPSDGGPYLNDVDENESIREQYITYRNKVKAFLEEPMTDYLPSTGTANTTDDDDDDRPTNLLRVDRLDKSITADQLYAAFNRYGKVQWVRVFPGGNNWPSGSVYPYHSARVCFERTESVDKAMADYQEPGCTINGGLVTFNKSKPGQ